MIYDGEGHIIQWIFVTNGQTLRQDFVTQEGFDVMMLISTSGHLTSTAVKNAMIIIKR